MSIARWWHPVEKALRKPRIVCELCPRRCTLADGDRGFCFVRQNVDNKLVLTTYGHSSGFANDPIEKKPLFHYLPGSRILSFGTAGCNMGCQFCQNHHISKASEMDRLSSAASPEEIADAAVHHGCEAVAYTYNDPVIFAEYAIDVAAACRARGVKNVAVTAAYINDVAREEFFAAMDAVNVDLKGFTASFYRKFCKAGASSGKGESGLDVVLDNIRWLASRPSIWMELTTLLIPGANDSSEEVTALSKWLVDAGCASVPLHFTAFHPDFNMLDVPPTPPATLHRARDIALNSGMQYVYTGNIHDRDSASTYCKKCNHLLIGRDWHRVFANHVEIVPASTSDEIHDNPSAPSPSSYGRCPHCKELLHGVFV